MKKNKFDCKKFLLLLISAITFCMGCGKLKEEPTSFVSPISYYTSQSQVESALAGALSKLWTAWNGWAYGWQCFFNDDQFAYGNLIIPEDFATPQWNWTYSSIMNLNSVIGAIEGGSMKGTSEDEVNLLMGQAKFVRAFNYFMLVRMFGPVPLITENTPNPATAKITRSSVDSVYNLIISDFNEAIATLPATWPSAQEGRPTRDAAKGLLAKVYLTMATYPLNEPQYYQKAADMAKQVIDSGVYSLVPDINNVFTTATKYGPEMMWSFNSNMIQQTTSEQVWSTQDGWNDFAPDPRFVLGDSTYPAYPEQPRKYAYIQIYPRNVTDTAGQSFAEQGVFPGQKKFQYDTQEIWDQATSTINMPIIRYADVLLIFAEADNMASGGPTQAAVDAINQVINRANGYVANAQDPDATINMSETDFDAKVIQERSWELCWEVGDRWFDLIRKHMLKQVTRTVYQQNFTPNDYLFPIPLNDIALNPLLTQNPGY